MAGAVKHMERSRRSHNKAQQYGIFNQFRRKADSTRYYKESRKTVLQQISSMLKRAVPTSK